jgi:serine O-acetyltransferase
MLATLRLLRADFEAKARWCYGEVTWRTLLRTVGADGSVSMVVYRAMQASRRHRFGVAEMALNRVNSGLLGCIIGRGAEFGPGFVLVHSNGVVINGAVRGGAGILIEHQVTIGAERRQSPVLGDNVFIGAGAKIIGPVHIGTGAKVGANAVVVHDVAAGTTVVGVPARPIRSGGRREA